MRHARLGLGAVAALLLAGCGGSADGRAADAAPALSVVRAYVAAPVGSGPAAMYLSVHNAGSAADTLESVDTEAAARTELHEQVVSADGRAEMHEVEPLPVAPGATLDLAPGGLHVMLLDVRGPLAAGDTVEARLHFRSGGAVAVRAPVISYAELARIYEGDADPHAAH